MKRPDMEVMQERAKALAEAYALVKWRDPLVAAVLLEDIPDLQAYIGELEAALGQLWVAYDPEDYLEGKDEDYGGHVLLERKAWQRVAKLRRVAELVGK